MEHAEAGIVAPSGERQVLAGRGDALAHGLDLALVLGAERVISLDLGDVGHAPLLRRDAVFAPASAHVDRSTSGATGFSCLLADPNAIASRWSRAWGIAQQCLQRCQQRSHRVVTGRAWHRWLQSPGSIFFRLLNLIRCPSPSPCGPVSTERSTRC